MKAVLDRLAAPILARIPDFSETPPARRAAIGFVASIVVHLLVIALLVLAGLLPKAKKPDTRKEAKPRELVLEMTPEPPPPPPVVAAQAKPTPTPEPRTPFIDSTGLISSDKPKNAKFESDQNMTAASEKPGTGDNPLPSQDGEVLPMTAFTTREFGPNATDPVPPTPEPEQDPSKEEPRKPMDTGPIFKPLPVTKEEVDPKKYDPKKELPQTAKTKDEAEQKMADESDVPPRLTAKPGDILFQPKPTPAPSKAVSQIQPVPPKPKSTPKEYTMLDRLPHRPRPVPKPGANTQLVTTKIEGGVSNVGKAAVDAVRTPLGVYKKHVADAIGSRWHFNIRSRAEMLSLGKATFTFVITPEGKISTLNMTSNTGNATLAAVSEQSIRETEIEPIPADVLQALNQGALEMDFSFTYYQRGSP